MKIQYLERDLTVFYKEVQNFPEGVAAAFHALENLHPSICERSFFGISHETTNKLPVYWAAVEELYRGEAEKYGCKTFVIGCGPYLTETIPNFMKNLNSIPDTFQTLLADPRRDGNSPCVEWYRSDREMICMIRLNLVAANS